MSKRILLAAPRGYCAGVDRAVITVEKALELYGAPVYVRKQIVHNKHVVSTLEARGAIFVDQTDEVPEGKIVVFSAHGVSPAVHEEAANRNLKTIDATCPLVTKVHHEARRFAAEELEILFIGHEKDSPLLDLVADFRASTPTDAAKRVVPDINEEIDLIEKLRDRASRFMRNMIELESSKIANLAARPVLRDPTVMITSRLEIITSLRDRSIRSFQGRLAIAQEELQQVTARVRALSPQATLDRGYAVVQLADGSIARDSDALKDGEKLRIRLAKGETSATVTS